MQHVSVSGRNARSSGGVLVAHLSNQNVEAKVQSGGGRCDVVRGHASGGSEAIADDKATSSKEQAASSFCSSVSE